MIVSETFHARATRTIRISLRPFAIYRFCSSYKNAADPVLELRIPTNRAAIYPSYRSSAIRRPDKFSVGSALIRSATSSPQLHIFALQDDILMDKYAHTHTHTHGSSFPASFFKFINSAHFRKRRKKEDEDYYKMQIFRTRWEWWNITWKFRVNCCRQKGRGTNSFQATSHREELPEN